MKAADYQAAYEESIRDPSGFWARIAERIDWYRFPTRIQDVSFHPEDFRIRWYEDGELNVSVNCLDRQLAMRADKTALLFEGDDPAVSRRVSYRELFEAVCRFGSALRRLGVKKGDRVTIYMPMIPEAAVAMLACARIGAVHSVVFGGFSPESLAGRIADCASTLVITADEGVRGGRKVPLKANVDAAIASHGLEVRNVVVVKRTGANVGWVAGRDVRYEDITAAEAPACEPERMNAEDPLFILYTSGSTGKPKGVLHTNGGYLVYVNYTFAGVFDYRDEDVFWCTADVGWVTGHSYIVYGPLSNGATTLMFEGVPNYPDTSRFWRVVDKHRVTIFYTAPTAIRALMREGDAPVKAASRNSLRLLGSVGEPINPEAWEWYHRVVGDGRCPVVDTWWQTETGGILISPLPGATALKAGSATRPLPGIRPALVDGEGRLLEGATDGNLVLLDSWPGQMRTVYGDHARFIDTYFTTFRGKYFTGDGARRDEDGYWWITGRVDDVMNVSGHRIGTAEVESALVAHPKVAEAAVVGCPHDIKGQGIYAYVTLVAGEAPSDGAPRRAGAVGAQGDRPDRAAGPHPVGAGPAENALRQDHAPDPAQDRQRRARATRRHLDARRSRRRHRPRREPPPGRDVRRPAAAALAAALSCSATAAERLTLATWNMDWMMRPQVFDALAARCHGRGRRPGGSERSIPCDLAPEGRWNEQDLLRLRAFAAALPADVVALQEIDGADAARVIFPEHEFCFTKRRQVQNVGFAIRRGLAFRCNRDYQALGLPEDTVRWGADLSLEPGTPREMRLLAVHLKASCNRDPLTADRDDCRLLQRQVPVLEDWIDQRARAGDAFGVIGDFNRRFDSEPGAARDADGAIVAMWPEIDDGDPAGADLVNPGVENGAVGCSNGHGERMPIDYLILGERLTRRIVPGSYRVWDYPQGGRWPDHCVLSIDLER